MKIAAVIVTYNRKKLLMECLEAIEGQSKKVDTILIVDNDSNDGTYEELQNKGILNDSKFLYKKLPKNIGGSGGFYEGMKLANEMKFDWIWIMDDDTIPSKDCLEKLVESISILPSNTSYLASCIYGEKKEVMNVPVVDDTPTENGYPDWYKYLSFGITKIKNATFVSLLINAEAINSVGYPVKDYFIWGDDTEYTLRLIKFFGPAYLIGNSVAIHKRKIAKSLSIYDEDNVNRINMYFYKYRNLLINVNYYFSKKKAFFLVLKNILLSIRLFFAFKCPYNFKKSHVILKATFSFLFKKYDYKAFKNRMDVNVKYEKI